MRCVRCGADWSPVVAVPVEAVRIAAPALDGEAGRPPEMLPEPSLVAEPEAPVRQMALDEDALATVTPVAAVAVPAVPAVRRGMPWLAIAWVVSVVAVIGGVAAFVVSRESVMQVWPPSIRAYVAMGLASRP